MITHSYIGQQPVYSEVLHCHIYPRPEFIQPVIEPKVILEHVTNEYNMTKHRIYQYLKVHGPCTATQISNAFGFTSRYSRLILRCDSNVFCMVNTGKPAKFAAVDNPVITNKSVSFRIYEYILEHGWATVSGLSRALDVRPFTIRESIRHHSEWFVRDGKYGKEKIWRLKEAA